MKYISYENLGDKSLTEVAERGDEVSQEIYDNMLNIMPPISLRGGQGYYAGFQVGEAYCHKEDKEGRFRPQFMTFVKSEDKCYYMGINFAGYVDSRDMEAENDEDLEME